MVIIVLYSPDEQYLKSQDILQISRNSGEERSLVSLSFFGGVGGGLGTEWGSFLEDSFLPKSDLPFPFIVFCHLC
jgi:hypothetical protein